MRIAEVKPKQDYTLQITTNNGLVGTFNVAPYLEFEAFSALKDKMSFNKVMSGGYFIEWDCGADLSADTIEAYLIVNN